MIRATRIELIKFADPERRKRWLEFAKEVQQIHNALWQWWLVYHVTHGSAEKLAKDIERYKLWKSEDKKTRGKKPKWSVTAFPETAGDAAWQYSMQKGKRKGKQSNPSLENDLYHLVRRRYPLLNTNAVSLVIKKWRDTISSRRAASGSLPGWSAVLFCNENIPTYRHPLPIPFSKKSIPSTGITKESTEYTLRVSIETSDGGTITDKAIMVLGKKKTASQRAIIDRVIDGRYEFKGSALVYNRGKWYASISYEMPKADTEPCDPGKVIHLIPGKKSPWILKQNGDKWRSFGNGRPATRMRQMIQNERWSRQEHNRWGSSATKGRGGRRAKAVWTKLSSRWKDFTKTYNNKVTKRLIDLCVERGIGTIVFHQPENGKRDQMFLAKSGKHPKSRMTWDWFQVGTQLKNKAAEYGIEVVVEKWCEKEQDVARNGKVRGNGVAAPVAVRT